MKHISTLFPKWFYSTLLLLSFSPVNAQNFPTDGGSWIGGLPDDGTPWAGDTIIVKPITPIGNGHPNAPGILPSICAIYYHNYIFITSAVEVPFTYIVQNEEQHTITQGHDVTSTTAPAIINLATLPSGAYTLLLYINNECLEGEFENN